MSHTFPAAGIRNVGLEVSQFLLVSTVLTFVPLTYISTLSTVQSYDELTLALKVPVMF